MQNDQLKISGATSGATLLKISQQPSNESLKVLTGVPFSSQPGSKKKWTFHNLRFGSLSTAYLKCVARKTHKSH